MLHPTMIYEPIVNQVVSSIEADIQVLEDAYAECFKDNVDCRTLYMIYSRIQDLKCCSVNRKHHLQS
jgi:hypothetical protein